MKIIFLGTGPAQAIPRPNCRCLTCRQARQPHSKSKRARSSLLIQTGQANILIDCSLDFLKQIKKTEISKIDAVFLTHRHQDAVGGLKFLTKWSKKPIIIYTEKINIKFLNSQLSKKSSNLLIFKSSSPLTFRPLKPLNSLKLPHLAFIPFRVQHGLTPIPTLGYLINNQIIYASDFGNLPLTSQKLIKNKPIAIFDAALYFGRKMKGHLNVIQTIKWAEKLKIKKLYLTQIGHSYPPYQKAQRQISQFLKKKYPQGKFSVKIAYDGLRIF